MERVIERLEELKLQYTANNIIEEILSRLRGPTPSWLSLRDPFRALEQDGIWIPSAENSAILEDMKVELESSQAGATSPTARMDISIVQPPSSMVPHALLRSVSTDTLLSLELLDSLNQTYFLHLLANDPQKILPPGKSLLSLLSRRHEREGRDTNPPTLQGRVEEVIHKAFWEEVCVFLSLCISNFVASARNLPIPYLQYFGSRHRRSLLMYSQGNCTIFGYQCKLSPHQYRDMVGFCCFSTNNSTSTHSFRLPRKNLTTFPLTKSALGHSSSLY